MARTDSRTRFVRRRWARRWLTWRYVLVGLVVALVVGGGVYSVYLSDWLRAEEVSVVGLDRIDESDVLAAARVPLGGPLATVDLDAVARRVGTLAGVEDVSVTRSWPHDVRIDVTEREAVAVVDLAGTLRAVDATGVVFDRFRTAPADLPRIDVAPAAGDDALAEGAKVVAAMPADVSAMVDHLELASIDDIDLALRDGRTVHWGSAAQSQEKGEVLLVLLAQPGQEYDVSVPGQPTVSGADAS
ncbi:MAG: cell division protein FtsQ [Nocardioides sp.]|nr:cell division protein FtsQ [Nocardioides sp.]